ncbi:MAG: 30S ribosomal protein S18 [Candidatus Nealsonbacteria bacterium CG18_big_fil_WC_8_21_14_2_50_37_10]|uniref:30S ribosomal protein S18 n=1 Tax=Candidatus Nealsonbacteria bacterium CG18_big_fil_WC_8_21_14_2_50_37_10 TaxID=1974717 RepID=A0A2H0FHV8_9BACT|nr:MAG: 30S ribosomal protein S18 [Candidatus Nealsonbacteria bacterium CG18_big_fil_WC_8_21_14_2_50_37_10]
MSNACYFCTKNIREIDFRDIEILERFISALGKIRGRKRTGVCAKHQRKLARAIKRARHLGLF